MADRNAIELNIGLRADDSQLAGDIARIKAKVDKTPMPVGEPAAEATKATEEATKKVEELGEETKKAGEKGKEAFGEGGLGGALRDAKKKFGEQIEVVQGLIGKLVAVGAVATTFYNIGKIIGDQIVDKLESASEKAANFLITVNKADAKSAVKQISDQVQKLNEEIADTDSKTQQLLKTYGVTAITGGVSQLFVKDRQKLIDERKKLLEDLKGLSNRVAGDKDKAQDEADAKEEDKRKALIERLGDLNAKAIIDGMDEESKIQAEAQEKIADIKKAFNLLSDQDRIAQEATTQQAIAALQTKAIQDIQARRQAATDEAAKKAEEERSKEEAWQDKIREWNEQQNEADRKRGEMAQKVRDDWMKSLQDIRQEINATFGQESANTITQFSQQLQVQTMQAAGNMNRIYTEGVG